MTARPGDLLRLNSGVGRLVCVVQPVDEERVLCVRVDFADNLGYSGIIVPLRVIEGTAVAGLVAVPLQVSVFGGGDVEGVVGRVDSQTVGRIREELEPYLESD